MKKETIKEAIGILIRWNTRKMDDRDAINEIFNVFMKDPDKELQKEWMRYQKRGRK